MNLRNIITKDFKRTLNKNYDLCGIDPLIISNKKTNIGHYQLHNLIKISNILKIKPYTVFLTITKNVQNKKIYKKLSFSDPGFINILINQEWLSQQLEKIFVSPRLGIDYVSSKNIIIDYSSPNIAKEMHIGHLRSTIIGDVSARVLSFLGHNVIRVNHIGDWGTQFGMLIAYLNNHNITDSLHENKISLSQLEQFYCKAQKKYESNALFSEQARKYVKKLQHGDQHCLSIWKKLVSITMLQNNKIYNMLNVTLNNNHIMGESAYNSMLPKIIQDLKQKNIAVECNKSTVVFLNDFKNRLGEPMGVIIQKKDQSFLYSTTEIACLKYRYQTLHADRIIYYTDFRQKQHLIQSWIIAKKANYIPKNLSLEHHTFGMILSKNKRPFKTRDGNTIKLSALLNESIVRTTKIIKQKQPHLPQKKLVILAKKIGISAVKYADLSKNRNTNYIFNWDDMLSLEGNTAPYIQYAYTRIISIIKKSTIPIKKIKEKIILQKKNEIDLAIQILEFEEVILLISKKGTPHVMCKYLYQLATCFSNFYENCPILFSKKIKTCKSRLKLSFLTAKTLKKGLNMLGIKTIQRM